MINTLACFLGAILSSISSVHAESQQVVFRDWQIGAPAIANTANSPTWGTPGCVATGPNGTILFSSDGINWEVSNSPLYSDQIQRTSIGQFAFGAGHFVGLGSNNKGNFTIRSSDGKHWDVNYPNNFGYRRSLVFENSIFVAITDQTHEVPSNQYDTFQISADGQTWESIPNPLGIQHIAYGFGFWIGHSLTNGIYKTSNFVDWIEVQAPPPAFQQHELNRVVFAHDRFILLGSKRLTNIPHLLYSDNGEQWHELVLEIPNITAGPQYDCIYNNGSFQMFGSKIVDEVETPSVMESSDGLTWTVTYQPDIKKDFRFYSATTWPNRPTITSSGSLHIQPPQDNWTSIDSSPNLVIRDITFSNGLHVGIGGYGWFDGRTPGAGVIYSSSDLKTWSFFTPDIDVPLTGVTYGNEKWVAVGYLGNVYTSANGIDWKDQSSPLLQATFQGVTFGAGHFIAYASRENRVYRSSDGSSWTAHDVNLFSRINAMIFANGQFVAVGDRAAVKTSLNGIDWTHKTVGIEGSLDTDEIDFHTIAFGKGRWITTAIDDSETEYIAYSDNGSNWAIIRADVAPREITYSQGWFIGSDFRVSRDGLNWRNSHRTFDELGHASILVTDNRFVALDEATAWHGTLDLAKPSTTTYFPEDTVEILSQTGLEYRIQSSFDLSTWTSHGDWKLGNGDYLMWNAFKNGRQKFWRILSREQQ